MKIAYGIRDADFYEKLETVHYWQRKDDVEFPQRQLCFQKINLGLPDQKKRISSL